MTITREQLHLFFETTHPEIINQYIDPLNKAMDHFQINTKERIAMFLAQVGHESAGLMHIEENLNYKAERLPAVFPKYFHDVDTNEYAHNPEKIANRVYANRMGNGPESSGDGYRFRGRGLIQLTGHDNYAHFASDFGITLENVVVYLATPEGACMSAAWFWHIHNLNYYSDARDVVKVTRLINGGEIGLAERTAAYNEALQVFA
jgi:putative chitinase